MTFRSARGGGKAVRRAHGVLLTLCVALTVLVHQEPPATDASAMADAAPAVHVIAEQSTASASPAPTHEVGPGACSLPGMPHCTAALVGSVQLAVPRQVASDPLLTPRQGAARRALETSAVGRAPPDLYVLSRLRL
ncbi:hypothetical protein ABZ835_44010 [Streptomyces sp. NPDC047461]|uniref:hypothetical protein n=1 Tax=Streptomyces sp. NPDC047461 TaxID=3155619 RepID=UPI0033ECA736